MEAVAEPDQTAGTHHGVDKLKRLAVGRTVAWLSEILEISIRIDSDNPSCRKEDKANNRSACRKP